MRVQCNEQHSVADDGVCVLTVYVACCLCVFSLNVSISCKRVNELDEDVVEWAFQLTKSNMQLL